MSYIYDEDVLTSNDLDPDLKTKRINLVNQSLNQVEFDGDSSIVKQKIVKVLELSSALNIKISMDVPICNDGNFLRMYDGMNSAFAATSNLLDIVSTEGLSDSVFLVRIKPFDLASNAISEKDFIVVNVFVEQEQTVRVEYFLIGDEGETEIESRVLNAFENATVLSTSMQSTFAYDLEDTRNINSGIMEYLVFNDPVLSLLYENTAYKKTPNKIRLFRRNKNRDHVDIFKTSSNQFVVLYEASGTGENVLRKILASLEYYWAKQSAVREVYNEFRIKMLPPLDLVPERYPVFRNTYKSDAPKFDSQPKYSYNIAMQNNPGVSLQTLQELAFHNIVLRPERWSEAIGDAFNVNVYLFTEEGLIVPHNQFGLYSRSNDRRSVLIFVKPYENDIPTGCMLISRTSTASINKNYKLINSKMTSNKVLIACLPPLLEKILGNEYCLKGVQYGDNPDGLVRCVKAAGTASYVDESTQDRIDEIYDQLSKFYAGAREIFPGAQAAAGSTQEVDEHGKYAGQVPGQPFSNKDVVESKPAGILHEFRKMKRYVNLLTQLCVWKFQKAGLSLEEFVDEHLKESSERIEFKATFDENDMNKIPVPNIEAIKFSLSRNIEPITRSTLSGFKREGSYRKGSIIQLDRAHFFDWANSVIDSADKYYNFPIESNTDYFLILDDVITLARNSNTFPRGMEDARLIKYENDKYFLYKNQWAKDAVVGWKNKDGTSRYTVCKTLYGINIFENSDEEKVS